MMELALVWSLRKNATASIRRLEIYSRKEKQPSVTKIMIANNGKENSCMLKKKRPAIGYASD